MPKKLTIEDMQALAAKKGGKCLTDSYMGVHAPMRWECAEGHQWDAIGANIKNNGAWCPVCSGNTAMTIEDMHVLAGSRDGKCLSSVYVNANTKLLWECANGHRWEAIPNSVKRGNWCRKCSGYEKLTIEEMRLLAEERGGKCLSDRYAGLKSKLLWQCADGHTWQATPGDIKSGQWCATCSTGIGERICRAFFEQMFGLRFPKVRPAWLVNVKGNRMELDGYCESLQLAFEHQGLQHYKKSRMFHRSDKDFKERQQDDFEKRKLCELHGITLIEIPEIPTLTKVEGIKKEIRQILIRNHVILPPGYDDKEIDLSGAYRTSGAREAYQELQAIAKQRGGEILSCSYVHGRVKHLWKCAKGHQWETTPDNVRSGYWCPHCAGILPLTIAEMNTIAQARNGRCISASYSGNKSKIIWECSSGHQWAAAPIKVKNGSWCPKCAGKIPLTIEEMREIASGRGGKCLSENYINNRIKLSWECAEGHRWEASPVKVKNGTWCPTCSSKRGTEKRKLSLDDMYALAQSYGGECVSEKYVTANVKLTWKCSQGHQWEARPAQIKKGHWCRICSAKRCGEKRKLSIEEMHRIASDRGGKCLSGEYTNSFVKLRWECSLGHQWEAIPSNVKRGAWCPHCKVIKARKTSKS